MWHKVSIMFYKKTFVKVFLTVLQLSFFVALSTYVPVRAMEEAPVIVLVDLNTWDLADADASVLNNKNILEVTKVDGWKDIVNKTKAVNVIIKHQSGYCGLYTAQGEFIREIKLKDQNIPAYYSNNYYPSTVENQQGRYWGETGYTTGGRMDPYRPLREPRNSDDSIQDYKRLSPGWGYKTVETGNKTAGGHVMDFARLMPLSSVTPFSYPGIYQGSSLAYAWGLGTIPHIGSFVANLRKSSSDRDNYIKTQQAREEFVDYPVQYYNSTEPSNPISRDPNYVRYQNPPQAFTQEQPNYGRDADYYRNTGMQHP